MAYLRLLWMYYDTEKPLPNKPCVLALKIGSDEELIQLLLDSFFVPSDGEWRHERCDEEIQKYHDYIKSQSERGKQGGRPKKTRGFTPVNPVVNDGNTSAYPEDNHGKPDVNPNRYPLSDNQVNSVPNGTGAKAPLTPDEIIFGYGVPMLTNAGTLDKQARSFLGGLRKAHGDDEVVNALRDCIREKPLQPLEWLAKRLPPKGAPPKLNKQEALEKRNGDIGRAWAEKMLKGQNETVADS